MIGFFEEVPVELEEAARIDGCSRAGVFLRIALRARPARSARLGRDPGPDLHLEQLSSLPLILAGVKTKTLPVVVYELYDLSIIWTWAGSTPRPPS